MSDLAIKVDNLSKRYRLGARQERYKTFREACGHWIGKIVNPFSAAKAEWIWAVKDVSFSVKKGEVLGVIGRNGAGKSTLLKILSRITEPTEGCVDLYGRVGSLLEVGTGFHPELTGRENIMLNGIILGMKSSEVNRKFDAIVAFAELDKFIDTQVKHYSSGMYMRLAFAVAAHLNPEILLVDEVLAVGDAAFQKKCLGKMSEVAKEGRTVLFVSHNMAAIKALCSRAILIQDGSIACDGPVDKVVDAYLTESRENVEQGIVPENMPRSGTGEARITRLELLNEADRPISQVYLGQKFRVALTVEASEEMEDVVLGIFINSQEGFCVASSFSSDLHGRFHSFKKGQHRILLDLSMTLVPRNYGIGAAVFRSNGTDIDYLEQVLNFSALGVAENSADSYRWNSKHGFVRPHGVWHEPRRIS